MKEKTIRNNYKFKYFGEWSEETLKAQAKNNYSEYAKWFFVPEGVFLKYKQEYDEVEDLNIYNTKVKNFTVAGLIETINRVKDFREMERELYKVQKICKELKGVTE